MTQTLRIKHNRKVNPEQTPIVISLDYQKISEGNYDTIVKGIPYADSLEFVLITPLQQYFIGHRPIEDADCQRLRIHFNRGHTFSELPVKTVVKCNDGELTIHYQGNNCIGQLYLPSSKSKAKPTNTIGGTKVTLERLV